MKCPRCGGGGICRPDATWIGECEKCRGALLVTLSDSSGGDAAKEGASAEPALSTVLLPEAFLARYELVRPIGEGASASVFLARDRGTGESVALKFLAQPGRRQVLARFAREAKLLAQVRHKNVIRLVDAGEIDGRPYLVSEFCGGGTLRSRMRPHPAASSVSSDLSLGGGSVELEKPSPVPPREAILLMLEVLAGLDACHKAGVIHRDLKPENVLLTDAGEIRVADLGVAREEVPGEPSLTPMGAVIGTPRYMAPEQVRGERATPATDVYAAGVILFEMLAGVPPFADERTFELLVAHLERKPPTIRDRAPEVPLALEALVLQALSKQPGGRPGSAGAFSRELKHILMILEGDEPDVIAPPAPASSPGKPLPFGELEPPNPWRSRIMPGAVLLAFVLVGASSLVAPRRPQPSAPSPAAASSVLPEVSLPEAKLPEAQTSLHIQWQQKFLEADLRADTAPDEARKLYNEAITIAEKLSVQQQAKTWLSYGQFEEKHKNTMGARIAYEKVLSLSKDEAAQTAANHLAALKKN